MDKYSIMVTRTDIGKKISINKKKSIASKITTPASLFLGLASIFMIYVQFYSIRGISKVNDMWFNHSVLGEFINITISGRYLHI
jgi:hypothetical protein